MTASLGAHWMTVFRCSMCWQEFDSAVALLEHEAVEDDRLYTLDLRDIDED